MKSRSQYRTSFGSDIVRAGNDAYGAWVRARQWTFENGTAGHLPRDVALLIAALSTWGRLEKHHFVTKAGIDWTVSLEFPRPTRAVQHKAGAELAAISAVRRVSGGAGHRARWGVRRHCEFCQTDSNLTIRACCPQGRAFDVVAYEQRSKTGHVGWQTDGKPNGKPMAKRMQEVLAERSLRPHRFAGLTDESGPFAKAKTEGLGPCPEAGGPTPRPDGKPSKNTDLDSAFPEPEVQTPEDVRILPNTEKEFLTKKMSASVFTRARALRDLDLSRSEQPPEGESFSESSEAVRPEKTERSGERSEEEELAPSRAERSGHQQDLFHASKAYKKSVSVDGEGGKDGVQGKRGGEGKGEEKTPTSPPRPAPAGKAPRRAETAFPEDFAITPALEAMCREEGLPPPHMVLPDFRDWALGNGIRKADWTATFRRWMRDPKTTTRYPCQRKPSQALSGVEAQGAPRRGLTHAEAAEQGVGAYALSKPSALVLAARKQMSVELERRRAEEKAEREARP